MKNKTPNQKKTKKPKKASKFNINKSGLNIDKAEYQEIVLSQTNNPNCYY